MGIVLASNFDVNAALPLDSRIVAADITARDAIASGRRYQGMQCFVTADTKTYVLKTGITNGDWVEVGSGSGGGLSVTDVFSGTGSQTIYTLSINPGTIHGTNIFVNGVYQQKATYTVVGTTLTFSIAPPTGTGNIEVRMNDTTSIGVPNDGTVTTAKIADGAVTTVKIANGAVTTVKMSPIITASVTYQSSSVPNGGTPIPGSSIVTDTGSFVTLSPIKFKPTRAMRVAVRATLGFTSQAWTTGNVIQINGLVNLSGLLRLGRYVVPTTSTIILPMIGGYGEVQLNANDELTFEYFQNSGSSKTLSSDTSENFLTITEMR